MDFKYSPEDESFRREVRTWLEGNLPPGWGTPAWKEPEDEEDQEQFRRWWHRRLYEGGWIGIAWPKEYGGRGATVLQQVVFNEELARLGLPSAGGQGVSLLGPTLILHGTEEQKQRFLPKVLTGEEQWAQGYSEPDAGSDLASLQTRAEEDGDDFILNGSKVWTSGAQHCEWAIMLVRTNPQAPKHRGISYLLMDMRAPGVTVKPLVQITGSAHFNQIFLDDVRVPKKNLVGEKDMGWYVAMTTLMFERSGLSSQIRFKQTLTDMIKLAQTTQHDGIPLSKDPIIRQKLAQAYIEVEIMKFNGYRALTRQLRGLPPGTESSLSKLWWSEMQVRMAETASQIAGPYSQLMKDSKWAVSQGDWGLLALSCRGGIIEQGSSEIQRNIIAERVLGLPR